MGKAPNCPSNGAPAGNNKLYAPVVRSADCVRTVTVVDGTRIVADNTSCLAETKITWSALTGFNNTVPLMLCETADVGNTIGAVLVLSVTTLVASATGTVAMTAVAWPLALTTTSYVPGASRARKNFPVDAGTVDATTSPLTCAETTTLFPEISAGCTNPSIPLAVFGTILMTGFSR